MSPNISIAIRFLRAKKRSMLMSVAGILFGVGIFISTQAQLSGFQELFISTILSTDGAIRIEDRIQETSLFVAAGASDGDGTNFVIADRASRRFVDGVEYPESIIEAIKQISNVETASPVLKGNVQLQSALRKSYGEVYGIDVDKHLAVSNLGNQVLYGSIADFRMAPMGVMLGGKLAARLDLRVGDSLIIQEGAESERFKLVAIYETGVSEIDKTRVFMHLPAVRALLGKPHGVSFIQLSLRDRDRALVDSNRIEEMVGHFATSWQEREHTWLQLFRTLKISAAITVTTIILVSGLGMFSTLFMIVLDKTREIAILRSMGYTRSDISNIFLWQGVIVLGLGASLGCAFGFLVTYGVSYVPMPMSGIFATDYFVVSWSLWHYVQAVAAASGIVLLSCLAPARRAARLVPGDVIRGTAT